MPDWTVAVEVLTTDFALVNRWDPPQFAWQWFGINEVEDNQYLSAAVLVSAPDEGAATALVEEMLSDYVAGHKVVAQRERVRPQPSKHRTSRLVPVPWQRAEVDAADVDIVWDSREPLERVDIAETATAVAITLHERRDPHIHYVGFGVNARRLRLRLAAPIGERALLDGSTGRAPGDLGIWDFNERELREQVLALDFGQLERVNPPDEIVHRS
jgi:hypothetical protein